MDASVKPDLLKSTEIVAEPLQQKVEQAEFYFQPDPWVRDLTEPVENLLTQVAHSDNPLMDTIGHHMLFGYAKRLRPIFILLAQSLLKEEILPATVNCAAAAELIHSASLFHDDVIDNSGTRKGKPSANSLWGNKSAVIMGDHFFVLAYTLISKQEDFKIINFYIDLCRRLAEGLMKEIKYTGNLNVTEGTHLDIIRLKTACFFQRAMAIGGYLGGSSKEEVKNLEEFGLNFGLAFQLSDDLLDLFADPKDTGKPRGSDIKGGIYTVPVIRALAENEEFNRDFRPILERGDITPDEIDEISASLKSNGAMSYAQSIVNDNADKAFEHLDKLPSGRASDSFRSMLNNIVSREF